MVDAQNITAGDTTRFDKRMERDRQAEIIPKAPRIKSVIPAEGAIEADDYLAKFELTELQVSGMQVYNSAGIGADLVGREVSIADLKQLAATLTARYRNDGYILSKVILPAQTITDGKVTLQAIEGRISFVDLQSYENLDGRTLYLARAILSKLTANRKPLNNKDLERALLLLGDLSGLSASAVISPSPDIVGTSWLNVILETNRYEGQFGIDNHGSRYLGPWQVVASGAINGMYRLRERFSYQLAFAAGRDLENELIYGSIGWEIPVTPSGLVAKFEQSKGETRPGYRLKEFDVEGTSIATSMELSYPFIRTRDLSLYGYGGLDMRMVKHFNNIDIGRVDKLRTAEIGMKIEAVDGLLGGGFTYLDLSIGKGLVFGKASRKGDYFLSRPDADPQAMTFNIDAERHQLLSARNTLVIGVSGQYASDALLSSREFGVGGSYIGRGFDPSELVGDHGLSMRNELRHRHDALQNRLFNGYMFGFIDSGIIWNDDATTRAQERQTLLSAGLGLRGELLNTVETDFTVAIPVNRELESSGKKDPRFLLSMRKRF